MQRFKQTSSPVVEKTINKKRSQADARSRRMWALINLVLAIFLGYELLFNPWSHYLGLRHKIFWYAECVLAVIFSLNTVYHILSYFGHTFSASIVELNKNQKHLLGVRDTDVGFKLVENSSKSVTNAGPIISPSAYTGRSYSGNSPFSSMTPSMSNMSPTQRTPSPVSHTPSPRPYSLNGSYVAGSGFGSHSGSFFSGSQSFTQAGTLYRAGSHHNSFNHSRSSPLSTSATLSPLFHESLDSSLRLRHHVSHNSSIGTSECMTDLKSLDSFLKDEHTKEMKSLIGSPDKSPGAGASFWNYGHSGVADYTPVFKKYQYQIACRSLQSTKSPDTDPDDPATFRGDEVWARLGVSQDELDVWAENLRKWISQTIMGRLVSEISTINRQLAATGSEDMQIGEVSISSLKSLAVTKGQLVPTLNSIIPFLEIGGNQEYLVQRLNELGKGGCIHEFRWNGGGTYKGRKWEETLPTDSDIIMHLLCTYMDSRLPAHPNFPDGKTFTNQHFMKTPNKIDFTKTDHLLLYQSKTSPPHFKVILEDDTWDLLKGRNNMFQAILLFLFHIKKRHYGMLGRVNLGLSGINLLWVIE